MAKTKGQSNAVRTTNTAKGTKKKLSIDKIVAARDVQPRPATEFRGLFLEETNQ